MPLDWSKVFEKFGRKVVTKTDKSKSAYVPNAAQCSAIAAAGILPSNNRPADEFQIKLLNDPRKSVGASFYHSNRETDPDRQPEPRMGHAFIRLWLSVGDTVVIGKIGKELFAAKEASVHDLDALPPVIASVASPDTILALAKKAKGKPSKKQVVREDYQRNIYVIAAALIRAAGKCEMPSCGRDLFPKDSGEKYLEVHHVVPLSEDGVDELKNVAALCPHCHREVHKGKNRLVLRKKLADHIATLA